MLYMIDEGYMEGIWFCAINENKFLNKEVKISWQMQIKR